MAPAQAQRRRLVIGMALLWFACCLLWSAPAALFAVIAQRAAPLQLVAVSGSFWRGRAGQAYLLLGDQRVALGSVAWRVEPWSLLWLHPGAHISTAYGEQFIDARVRFSPLGNWQLRALRAAAPLQLAGHWLPLPARGVIALNIARADLAGGQLRALQGEVQWQRAGWQWRGRWLPLGNYRAQLQLQNAAQLQGALRADGAFAGSGEIAVDLHKKHYRWQMQLTPAAALPADFRDGAAALLAVERAGQGRWLIRRSGGW
jgi:hypothetical protein